MREAERDAAVSARIEIEKAIVGMIVQDFLGLGYKLSVSLERGYDHEQMLVASRDEKRIMEEAFAGDECHLFVHDPNKPPFKDGHVNCKGWVFFVFGNSGYDVIADYTTNLQRDLARAEALADAIEDEVNR